MFLVRPHAFHFPAIRSKGTFPAANFRLRSWGWNPDTKIVVWDQLEKQTKMLKNLWWYCWWKKSCTTWDGWNPANNGVIIILGGEGFCPSTVLLDHRILVGQNKIVNYRLPGLRAHDDWTNAAKFERLEASFTSVARLDPLQAGHCSYLQLPLLQVQVWFFLRQVYPLKSLPPLKFKDCPSWRHNIVARRYIFSAAYCMVIGSQPSIRDMVGWAVDMCI